MARLKTAYRGTTSLPPSAGIPAAPSMPPLDNDAGAVAVDVRQVPESEEGTQASREAEARAAASDQAKFALLKQIQQMRAYEDLQRQHQAAMMAQPQQPISREDKLNLWESQGMPKEERAFFEANPELVDHPQLTALAAHEAE